MKAIVIADVHIANRRLHNLGGDPLFRLHQFAKVSDRLYSYCLDNEIEEIWIAGDLVDDPTLKPEEAHVVHSFIKRLLKTGCKIRYILGNHDVSTKSQTEDSSDRSLVPLLMDYPNIEYMHKKVLEVGGVKVAFQNWEPNLSVVDWFDHADLYIGHVNILEGRFGQKFDQSRFDLGLCGDIHMKTKKDKTFSTGAVIQSNAGDSPDGSFVHLEISDGKIDWHYVDTAVRDEYEFLRVYREDKMPEDYVEGMYDVIIPVETSQEMEGLSEEEVDALFDSEENLENSLENESDEVANLIKSCLNSINVNELNLSTLKFDELSIHNFRNISDKTFDLGSLEKLNRISGAIGQGKSSIVRAMDYVFAGKGSPKSKIKFGEKEMWVTVSYSYKGIDHVVTKSGQYISKWIRNGEEQEAGSKKELQELFLEDNPWIVAWKVIYHDQHSSGFLMGMNVNDRIKFMSKILGFEGIFETNEILKSKQKEAIKHSKELEKNRDIAMAVADSKGEEIEGTFEDFRKEREEASDELDVISEKISKAYENRTELVGKIDLQKKKADAELELQGAKRKLSETEQPIDSLNNTEDDVFLIGRFNSLKTEGDLEKIMTQGLEAKEELYNPPNKCNECGNKIDVPDTWKESKQKRIDDLIVEYRKVEEDVEERKQLEDKVKEAKVRISQAEETKKIIAAYSRAEQAVVSAKKNLDQYSEVDAGEDFESQLEIITEEGKQLRVEQGSLQKILADIDNKLNKFNELDKLLKDFENKSKAVDDYASTLDDLERAVFSTSLDGPVLSKTLAAAAQTLSDGIITVRTTKISAKKVVPDFNVELSTKWGPIPYDELSGGQLALVDIYLSSRIAKLIGGIDLLILDETFKFLDQESVINVLDQLKTCDINKVLMIAHGSSLPQVTKNIEA